MLNVLYTVALCFNLKFKLHPIHHGFIKSKSTLTNLVTYLNDALPSFYSQGQFDCVDLDLSEAFDKVPHFLPLNKLSNFGLTSLYVKWFQSYKSPRTFPWFESQESPLCYLKYLSYSMYLLFYSFWNFCVFIVSWFSIRPCWLDDIADNGGDYKRILFNDVCSYLLSNLEFIYVGRIWWVVIFVDLPSGLSEKYQLARQKIWSKTLNFFTFLTEKWKKPLKLRIKSLFSSN